MREAIYPRMSASESGCLPLPGNQRPKREEGRPRSLYSSWDTFFILIRPQDSRSGQVQLNWNVSQFVSCIIIYGLPCFSKPIPIFRSFRKEWDWRHCRPEGTRDESARSKKEAPFTWDSDKASLTPILLWHSQFFLFVSPPIGHFCLFVWTATAEAVKQKLTEYPMQCFVVECA